MSDGHDFTTELDGFAPELDGFAPELDGFAPDLDRFTPELGVIPPIIEDDYQDDDIELELPVFPDFGYAPENCHKKDGDGCCIVFGSREQQNVAYAALFFMLGMVDEEERLAFATAALDRLEDAAKAAETEISFMATVLENISNKKPHVKLLEAFSTWEECAKEWLEVRASDNLDLYGVVDGWTEWFDIVVDATVDIVEEYAVGLGNYLFCITQEPPEPPADPASLRPEAFGFQAPDGSAPPPERGARNILPRYHWGYRMPNWTWTGWHFAWIGRYCMGRWHHRRREGSGTPSHWDHHTPRGRVHSNSEHTHITGSYYNMGNSRGSFVFRSRVYHNTRMGNFRWSRNHRWFGCPHRPGVNAMCTRAYTDRNNEWYARTYWIAGRVHVQPNRDRHFLFSHRRLDHGSHHRCQVLTPVSDEGTSRWVGETLQMFFAGCPSKSVHHAFHCPRFRSTNGSCIYHEEVHGTNRGAWEATLHNQGVCQPGGESRGSESRNFHQQHNIWFRHIGDRGHTGSPMPRCQVETRLANHIPEVHAAMTNFWAACPFAFNLNNNNVNIGIVHPQPPPPVVVQPPPPPPPTERPFPTPFRVPTELTDKEEIAFIALANMFMFARQETKEKLRGIAGVVDWFGTWIETNPLQRVAYNVGEAAHDLMGMSIEYARKVVLNPANNLRPPAGEPTILCRCPYSVHSGSGTPGTCPHYSATQRSVMDLEDGLLNLRVVTTHPRATTHPRLIPGTNNVSPSNTLRHCNVEFRDGTLGSRAGEYNGRGVFDTFYRLIMACLIIKPNMERQLGRWLEKYAFNSRNMHALLHSFVGHVNLHNCPNASVAPVVQMSLVPNQENTEPVMLIEAFMEAFIHDNWAALEQPMKAIDSSYNTAKNVAYALYGRPHDKTLAVWDAFFASVKSATNVVSYREPYYLAEIVVAYKEKLYNTKVKRMRRS